MHILSSYRMKVITLNPSVCKETRKINEEEEPTRCYLVFYYTYERLNIFRAALCPSSGAHDYISDYHMDRLIL
jgi:hypothetical protein